MKLDWRPSAYDDYLAWREKDGKIFARINELVRAIQSDPFKGIGKPEPLQFHLKGWWSRRITGEHRLVYRVIGKGERKRLEILQCRYHY